MQKAEVNVDDNQNNQVTPLTFNLPKTTIKGRKAKKKKRYKYKCQVCRTIMRVLWFRWHSDIEKYGKGHSVELNGSGMTRMRTTNLRLLKFLAKLINHFDREVPETKVT